MEKKEQELIEKKKEITKLIPLLEKEQQKSGQTQATLFEGFRAVKNFYWEVIDTCDPGEEYYIIGAKYSDTLGKWPFFDEFHTVRADKGVIVNMLADDEVYHKMVAATKRCSKIRWMPSYLSTNQTILIYRNKAAIIIWTKQPIGIVIDNADCAKSFRKYFKTLWDLSKD
jgi:hypothetical protein